MHLSLQLGIGGAFVAAALAFTNPVFAQEGEGPIVTAGSTESADALRIREAIAYSYDLPRGAPSEDYPLVAWCEALVNGHVALGESLVDPDPLDVEIIRLARLEAADFNSALVVARPSQDAATRERARIAAGVASAQWTPLMAQADPAARSQAFGLFFGLPGRCEHAARRIRGNITSPPTSLADVGLAAEDTGKAN